MVLVSDKLSNNTGILQTKLSYREGHKARRGGLEPIPLEQHICVFRAKVGSWPLCVMLGDQLPSGLLNRDAFLSKWIKIMCSQPNRRCCILFRQGERVMITSLNF
jgi:hypothetical protein